jgi:HEAT repeat protein
LNEEFEPLVRAHAAWALGKSNAPAALAALEKALSREVDPIILEEIQYAIQQF